MITLGLDNGTVVTSRVIDDGAGMHATVLVGWDAVTMIMRRDVAEKMYAAMGAALWPVDPDSDFGEVVPIQRPPAA